MRHLINIIGVGPTDLIPQKIIMVTALTDCPVRCRTFGTLRRIHVKLKNDYPQLRDRRAESPKAHSPGHRPGAG